MENMDTSDNPNKTTILDLNEDCLTEIVKYMEFNDFCNLSKAHQHFRNSINRVVAQKSLTIEIDYPSEMHNIAKFLIIFGDRLQRMKIQFPSHYHYKIDEVYTSASGLMKVLIENLCSKGNIKHLSLANHEYNQTFISSLQTVELDIKQRYFAGC